MDDEKHSWENLYELADEDGRENSLLNALWSVEERYQDSDLAGTGAMKKIIRAEDKVSGRVIAKAVLKNSQDEQTVESFLREARITAMLQHPNIVPLYDIGLDDQGQPYFTMKLIKGLSLRDILDKLIKNDPKTLKDYPLPKRIDIFLKVCDAIAYAHSRGIAHLDLKPENITVSTFSDVVVCDWGLAAIIGHNEDMDISLTESLDYYSKRYYTLSGEIKGTPGYMAPEQARGGYEVKDERSDIFALGSILYELLSLENAIDGEGVKEIISETLTGHFIKPSKKRPDLVIPESLEAICMKALRLSPQERYQSVEKIISEIETYRNGYLTEAEEASFGKQLALIYKRNRAICLLTMMLTSVIFIGSLIFIESLRNEKNLTSEALRQSEKLSKEASLSYLFKGRNAYYRFMPSQATEAYEAALVLDKGDVKQYYYLAKALCVQQKYSESHKVVLKGHDLIRHKRKDAEMIIFYSELEDLQSVKVLSVQELYPIVQNFFPADRYLIFKSQIFTWAILNTERTVGNEIQEIEADINWLLSKQNKTPIKGKLEGQYKGFKFDLSGHPQLQDIRYISQFTFTELNIRGCDVKEMALVKAFPKHPDMDAFQRVETLLLDEEQAIHKYAFVNTKLLRK
ncbi:probable serine/threonine-protein kinase pknB [Lentisphaera araneosa HTCC2155]|uniref:Probable serine/threonine-protein kinase pknB n=1 Tax=Lentisphaera araneosa HTCC2155 TaxID=313628 RepID=A6DMS3_9BACT|nr:serine/threonine-protein kinase [Lentisphaera araneosa]EDM26959.1 probable serine/threonine-protein kinase pknB [Lentisphaera araneosa HTCC2155]